jgi:hypothetical protein
MVWTTDGWKPSTDIAAAMEVLKSSARGGKKMIPLRLWLWNLHFEPQWGWDVGLHCGASVPEDGYDVEMKTQPSLALAICRAALKAVR